MNIVQAQPLRIAIVGAGFSGTALAATLHRAGKRPCEITLFDKSGRFGAGDAYRTPFPFHWLNVRASDMSAFEDEPDHYVKWLQSNQAVAPYLDKECPINDQYTPRILYGTYLKQLLQDMQQQHGMTTLRLESTEVVDVAETGKRTMLTLKDGRQMEVDKVVFAMGNHAVQDFPFPVSEEMKCIRYAWDYLAPSRIKSDEPVMIVGTGLSMIDTVLTLYHQGHRGKIYAVSRHGLLPLSHAKNHYDYSLLPGDTADVRGLAKWLRGQSESQIKSGGDWRAVMNAVRKKVPGIWSTMAVTDKKRFLRHLVPYWNIHRHRVHWSVDSFLQTLITNGQLVVIAGHVQQVESTEATVKLRKSNEMVTYPIKWLINCMGPANDMSKVKQSLLQALFKRRIAALDELKLGFAVSEAGALKSPAGKVSSSCYTVGPSRRGAAWEAGAVPEIRKQVGDLAAHLLKK